jgi:hypothetical protein
MAVMIFNMSATRLECVAVLVLKCIGHNGKFSLLSLEVTAALI